MVKLKKSTKTQNKVKYNQVRKAYDNIKNKRGLSYTQFKHRVKSRLNVKRKRGEKETALYKFSKKEIAAAAKKEANTETFVSAAERSRENLVESMKTKFGDSYDRLRQLTRYEGETIHDESGKILKKSGQFEKMGSNLVWDQNKKGYTFLSGGKQYLIDISNSPEEINIIEVA